MDTKQDVAKLIVEVLTLLPANERAVALQDAQRQIDVEAKQPFLLRTSDLVMEHGPDDTLRAGPPVDYGDGLQRA